MKGERTCIVHGEIQMHFEETDNGQWLFAFDPGEVSERMNDFVSFPLFQAALAGFPQSRTSGSAFGYSKLPLEAVMEQFDADDRRIAIRCKHPSVGLAVVTELELIPGTSVIRQHTTAINEGDQPIVLTQLSSAQGIAMEGELAWHDSDKIRVHYCRQAWGGEGQWRQSTLEELGLYPTTAHPLPSVVQLSSTGSYSSSTYAPMVVVEDRETEKVWFMQLESSSNWNIELGHRRSWDQPLGSLYLYADGANERAGGWTKTLEPGERYVSIPVAFGCCRGGFESALNQLTRYRRACARPESVHRHLPIVFNDYMNCLWGDPTREKLLPLVRAAAEAGAECFCIDAGWFSKAGENWSMGLGDWQESTDRFGTEGLRGVIRHIRECGMIAGLWLEMEVCGASSELGEKPDAWFLQRNGKRVGGGARWFLDYSNPEVRAYIHGVIDRLVALGVGYFKNDYNDTPGYGNVPGDHMPRGGASSAEGTVQNSRAFYAFIAEVRQRHPALILENCASGAMRQDYGILRLFDLQSISDQEMYERCPSIIAGSLASVTPERLGIWAYPYPVLYSEMHKPHLVFAEEYQLRMADGEQTIYTMINGLCGHLYLSGRMDAADERNKALIAEGVALAKRERAFKEQAFPFWPLGFSGMQDSKSWKAVGLVSDDGARALLALWRGSDAESDCEVPLDRWRGQSTEVALLYPSQDTDVSWCFDRESGGLQVRFPRRNQARFFEIKLNCNL